MLEPVHALLSYIRTFKAVLSFKGGVSWDARVHMRGLLVMVQQKR